MGKTFDIPVEKSNLPSDPEKVQKLLDAIQLKAQELEVTALELGMAICLLQEHILVEYHALPVSGLVREHVLNATLVKEA